MIQMTVQNSRDVGLWLKKQGFPSRLLSNRLQNRSFVVLVVQWNLYGAQVTWYGDLLIFFFLHEASLQKMWAGSVWQVQHQTVELPNHGI